jgi:Spy/CpxP family protein refolding chaperone
LKLSVRSALVTIVLAALAGVGGMWLGGRFLGREASNAHSLHTMVHEELKLSHDQDQQIETLEATFSTRKKALEAEMRKANTELAAAIRNNETAGADVTAAVHHFHEAMGALQTETIEHVFAMRKVLTPEQRNRFDDKIAQALTSNPE